MYTSTTLVVQFVEKRLQVSSQVASLPTLAPPSKAAAPPKAQATPQLFDETKRYALVVPMHLEQQLEVMRITWSLFPPCADKDEVDDAVDLIFLTDIDLPSLNFTGYYCFGRVYQLPPLIPDCYNVYAQGPPYCFFAMMLHLGLDRKYEAILQVEADAVPVSSNWLQTAVEGVLAKTSGDVWIQAAMNRFDGIFNGNGAYNLQNRQFRDFLMRYRQWFYKTASNSGDTAFDTNMIRFAKEIGIFNEFSSKRLQASTFLRNCHLMSVAACHSAVNQLTWGGATNQTIFVHSHDIKDPRKVRDQVVELLGGKVGISDRAP